MLLLLLVVIPLGGALVLLLKKEPPLNIPLITCTVLLATALFGLRGVFQGNPSIYRVGLGGPFAPVFQGDWPGAVFVILTIFLWFVVSVYAPEYMEQEGGARNFQGITLLTLAAVLGVFLAGDLLTMLLFFELMTISSFFWVVHRWDKKAVRAGYFYLFFSIIGGLFIALGIVLLGASTARLPDIGQGFLTPLNSAMYAWSLGLLAAGFGIKAGMAPLHLWLPHAHSAAPTPGSALLSGLLIKVGAYGLIRVGEFAGWGQNLSPGISWLGPALTFAGLITMLVGVMAALLQSDAKRLLAYHSVSQMGYIILGLGLGLYLGPNGGLGLLGALYHIVNHALFKAALFLGVGIIYRHTKETNLYELGGLWSRFPITAALMLLACLGITGAPGLNGYASKTLLHHAVNLAVETQSAPWLIWLERLFTLVGVGTAASFSKLYYLMFLGRPGKTKIRGGRTPRLELALGLLIIVMVGIGLQPEFFPRVVAAPIAQTLGFKNASSGLAGLSFWNSGDIGGIFLTLALGLLVCWGGLKSGAFHWHPPLWLSLEDLGRQASWRIALLARAAGQASFLLRKSSGNLIKKARKRLSSAYWGLTQPKEGKVGGIVLAGVSANAALLIVTLLLLIVWYTMINPNPPGLKISGAFLQQIENFFSELP